MNAIFTALERLGKRVEFRLYEGEGHVLTQAPNVLDFWKRRLECFAEHLDLGYDVLGRIVRRNGHRPAVSGTTPSAAAPGDSHVAQDREAMRTAADENAARLGDCTLYPSWKESPYVLPWEAGQEFLVTRTTGHYIRPNGGVGLYALDVPMPIGTTIVAARAGRVVAIQEAFVDGNGEDLEENFVFIRHEDGTIARYFHLTHDGALVGVGDVVRQGQPIALSGNTGDSAGPHLHFDVQACGPNLPPRYNALPCGQTVPLTFRNTRANACGLVAGERYEARD